MSEYLLLTDRSICPSCRRKSAPSGYGQCRSCGMMLFDNHNDFKKYEDETGWREYWVFGKIHGWRHRSHLFDENSKPLTRKYEIPKLDDDYGTQDYVNRQMANAPDQIEKRKLIKKLKKKPVTVRKTV